MRNMTLVMVLILFCAFMTACERAGPAERAGEKLDDAVEEVKDSGKDLGNALEDACEDIKEGAGAEDKDC